MIPMLRARATSFPSTTGSTNPELRPFARPFVDPGLRRRAIVKLGIDLDPERDLGLLNFRRESIFPFNALEQAKINMEKSGRCLIIGPPLSGKTWIAYQIARQWKGFVVQPTRDEPPDEFDGSSFLENPVLLLIDNAQDLANTFNFHAWREVFRNREGAGRKPNIIIAARDGPEWDLTRRNCPQIARFLDFKVDDQRVIIAKISSDSGGLMSRSRASLTASVSGGLFFSAVRR